jgi:tripartite-type tricarboxylate transporter receptor subunit TctC
VDLIGGQIPMACTSLNSVLPHHRSGRLRTLAVMKEERSVSAPDIPAALGSPLWLLVFPTATLSPTLAHPGNNWLPQPRFGTQ